MRFHHMAIFVADMDAALHLWRDVLGFSLVKDDVVPDGQVPGPRVYLTPALLDDIFKVQGARSRMAILVSDEGAIIELQQCANPPIARTPPLQQRYAHTGITNSVSLSTTSMRGSTSCAARAMQRRRNTCGRSAISVARSFSTMPKAT